MVAEETIILLSVPVPIAVLGIDPGIKGNNPGAALLWSQDGAIRIFDWCNEVDASFFLDECCYSFDIQLALIEKQWSRPTDSRGNADKLIGNYHFWRGLLISRKIPFRAMAPNSWRAGLPFNKAIPDPKQRSLEMVRSMFSEKVVKRYFKFLKNHGRADAAIMAYRAQLYTGKDFKRP